MGILKGWVRKMARTITSGSGNVLGRTIPRIEISRNESSAAVAGISIRERVGQGLLWLSFAWGLGVGVLGIALFLEYAQAVVTGTIANSVGVGPMILIALVAGLPFFIAGLILNRGTIDRATNWGLLGLAIAVASLPVGIIGGIIAGLIIL